ncbi:hypothetical protein niasHT_002469 [Heterodera trifolii]|uniref:Uncharacterized protein n=1 Tax=Heterodera trifolii TaxID=157864 RepID=A0ABD2LMB5_9BILA
MPTPLRASSVGSCSLVARIGALFAPMVIGLPQLLLGCECLLAQMSAEDEADAGGMEEMKRNDERATMTGKDLEGTDEALMKPQ